MALGLPNDLEQLPAALSKPHTDSVSDWLRQRTQCLPALSDQAEVLRLCTQ